MKSNRPVEELPNFLNDFTNYHISILTELNDIYINIIFLKFLDKEPFK